MAVHCMRITIGKPFGDTLFDWDEVEKEEDCKRELIRFID